MKQIFTNGQKVINCCCFSKIRKLVYPFHYTNNLWNMLIPRYPRSNTHLLSYFMESLYFDYTKRCLDVPQLGYTFCLKLGQSCILRVHGTKCRWNLMYLSFKIIFVVILTFLSLDSFSYDKDYHWNLLHHNFFSNKATSSSECLSLFCGKFLYPFE